MILLVAVVTLIEVAVLVVDAVDVVVDVVYEATVSGKAEGNQVM